VTLAVAIEQVPEDADHDDDGDDDESDVGGDHQKA
jgi:hypothetical protein